MLTNSPLASSSLSSTTCSPFTRFYLLCFIFHLQKSLLEEWNPGQVWAPFILFYILEIMYIVVNHDTACANRIWPSSNNPNIFKQSPKNILILSHVNLPRPPAAHVCGPKSAQDGCMYQGHLRQRVRLPIFSCLPSYSALSANPNYAVQAVPLSLTVVYIFLP